MSHIFIGIITIFISFVILIFSIGLIRAKDVFSANHLVMIFNLFLFPIIIFAIEFENLTIPITLKIIAMSIINVVICNIVCYLIVRRALNNNISPDATDRTDNCK